MIQQNTPKVSIIVPIYNAEKYLRQCIDSVVVQTLRDIEIVIVDDVGSDGSMEIAREAAQKDGRIKIITHAKNGGTAAARNSGIKNSSAPYLMFLDNDDFYEAEMCEKMLCAIEESGADLACCGPNIIYEADNNMAEPDAAYFKIKFDGLNKINDEIILNTDDCVWNKIFRRDILTEYDICFPEGIKYEDMYFFKVYALRSRSIFFVQEKLYNYRRRAGSIMNQTYSGNSGFSIDHLRVAIEIYRYLKKHDLLESRKHYMWDYFFSLLQYALCREAADSARHDIYNLAADFIERENWKQLYFPMNIDMQHKLYLIKNKILLGETNTKNI